MVGAAGCGLVRAGGVLELRPRGSRCALAARALPSQLALQVRGLFAQTLKKQKTKNKKKQNNHLQGLNPGPYCLPYRTYSNPYAMPSLTSTYLFQ
jgi:hypothetical protein